MLASRNSEEFSPGWINFQLVSVVCLISVQIVVRVMFCPGFVSVLLYCILQRGGQVSGKSYVIEMRKLSCPFRQEGTPYSSNLGFQLVSKYKCWPSESLTYHPLPLARGWVQGDDTSEYLFENNFPKLSAVIGQFAHWQVSLLHFTSGLLITQ